MNHLNTSSRRQQQGIGLLEALIAVLVLSLGVLTVSRLQTHLRLGSDTARQRAEAVRLGQEDIETLRAFSVLAASGAARSYAGITSASASVDASTGYATNTRYTVSRQIEAAGALAAKTASVTVGWTDRAGDAQKIVLNSVIAASDAAYGGALGIAPVGVHARGASARSSRVPLSAHDLGNGSSVFKPTAASTIAYVFDNTSGRVTARCSGIDPLTATRDLGLAQLTNCSSISAQSLSGTVRFSQASPPDAARGNDAPPAFDIVLGLSGGSYASAPECSVEPVQTESGDRFVRYHCLVLPLANGRWSGRSTIAPTGWAVGNGANERKVCRYTTDLDSSGAIDRNEEHPAAYSSVDHALANQNFLVVKGSETCPAGTPNAFVDMATTLHQP
jgi:Tfp pilus assembly protein PilV